MATARKIEVERKVVEVRGYDLHLTPEEAQFLADVTSRIGGDSTHSRRKHSDAISGALRTAGVDYNKTDDLDPEYPGGMRFINPDEAPSRMECGCA